MKEIPGYRQTVEYLTEQTGGKAWLTTAEVARLLGVDRHTVNKRFGIKNGCALTVLALRMVQESR